MDDSGRGVRWLGGPFLCEVESHAARLPGRPAAPPPRRPAARLPGCPAALLPGRPAARKAAPKNEKSPQRIAPRASSENQDLETKVEIS